MRAGPHIPLPFPVVEEPSGVELEEGLAVEGEDVWVGVCVGYEEVVEVVDCVPVVDSGRGPGSKTVVQLATPW